MFMFVLKFINWIFSPFTTTSWTLPLSQFFMLQRVNSLILQLDNLSRGCCEEQCPNLTNIQKNYNHFHFLSSGIHVSLKSEIMSVMKESELAFVSITTAQMIDFGTAWGKKGTAHICLGKVCTARSQYTQDTPLRTGHPAAGKGCPVEPWLIETWGLGIQLQSHGLWCCFFQVLKYDDGRYSSSEDNMDMNLVLLLHKGLSLLPPRMKLP